MDQLDIINILGVGLSGFGFLLMYLAYRLINKMIEGHQSNPAAVKMINRYMLICLIMTVTVGVFTYITGSYKKQVITEQQKKLDSNKSSIKILLLAHQNQLTSDKLVSELNERRDLQQVRIEQVKLLDTLGAYFKTRNDSSLNLQFKVYQTGLLNTSDSLKMNLSKPRLDTLKQRMLYYNRRINELSVDAAINQ